MTTVKSHRFPVSIEWVRGRLTTATAAGKPAIGVATPPEFKGGIAGVWSPEDLLVAATASCYAVTLLAVAERREIELFDLEVGGIGHVERRSDGHLGFVSIELVAKLLVDRDHAAAAERAARDAEEMCIVGVSLDAPIHLETHVVTRADAQVA